MLSSPSLIDVGLSVETKAHKQFELKFAMPIERWKSRRSLMTRKITKVNCIKLGRRALPIYRSLEAARSRFNRADLRFAL